jgi:hypothetical protein
MWTIGLFHPDTIVYPPYSELLLSEQRRKYPMQNFYHDLFQLLIGSSSEHSVYLSVPVSLYLLSAVALSVSVPRR